MSVRTQRGQLGRQGNVGRLPGQVRQRRVTVPPIQRHDPAPAILALKAEIDRLINEVGLYIGNDGRITKAEALSPLTGDMVIKGTLEVRNTGANATIDLQRVDQNTWRLTSGGSGDLVIRDATAGVNVMTIADGADADSIVVDASGQTALGVGVPNAQLTVEGTTKLKEQSAADADTAAYGQVWVKDDAPNTLWFTDDAGNDYQLGPAGGIYGGISATDNTTATSIASAGVAVQVTIFDTNSPSSGLTPDHTNDHVTVVTAGDYMITVSATVNSGAGAASRMEMTVQKNNGATVVGGLHVDRNLAGGGGTSGSVSMSGIATLAASDTIEVWVENETNAVDYTLENINLALVQVG